MKFVTDDLNVNIIGLDVSISVSLNLVKFEFSFVNSGFFPPTMKFCLISLLLLSLHGIVLAIPEQGEY